MAYRKTLLYGLTLRAREKVHYEPLNAEESHAIFIQQALVEGRYQPRGEVAEFVQHNSNLMADIEKLETKTRRRNLLVDDSAINRYYAERLPTHVSSRSALEKWLRQGNEEILKLDRETLLQAIPDANHGEQFPDHLEVLGKKLTLEYKFNPGRRSDGVTMTIPISVLAPFPDHIGDWLVPGLLREKCVALIKTLPKPIRRNFAPAADAIDRIANRLTASDTPLTAALADLLYHTRGVKVTAADFAPAKLDSFYHMNYRVIDVDGSLIEEGRDLASLKQSYANAVKQSVHASHAPERLALEQHQITDWNFGTLDSQISYQHQGMTVNAYPMLKRRQDGAISLLVHDDKRVADYHSHHGIIELAKTVLTNTTQKQSLAYLRKELMRTDSRRQSKPEGLSQLGQKLKQATTSSSDHSQWTERIINASLLHCCFGGDVKAVRDHSTFSKGLSQGGKDWVKTATELESLLSNALDGRDSLLVRINAMPIHDVQRDQVLEDMKAQLYRLFEPSLLSYTSPTVLRQLPRYLNAIEARLEKLEYNIEGAKNEPALSELQTKLDEKVEMLMRSELEFDFVFLSYPELSEFKIMLEEWRVSLYAQHLKANMKVSEKRLKSFWSALDF
jgi:ATP-dependent helicase HrpA